MKRSGAIFARSKWIAFGLFSGFLGIAALPAPEAVAGEQGATESAAAPAAKSAGGHGDAAEVGRQLSDPTSDVWAHFTQFSWLQNDGDVNDGNPEQGGAIVYQPILPVPLYGPKENRWKMIVRPTIPLALSTPIPDGPNSFDDTSGLADTLLPLLVCPPASPNWILGVGPSWLLPTSTDDDLGDQQFGLGPAAVVGYKNAKTTVGVFPQYNFGIGSRGDQDGKPDVSKMSLLYFAFLNLPEAWQVGMNPIITYNDKASSDNKWNVPMGLLVAKTTKIGGRPWKFQLGAEYSVVSQDDFGKRFLLKLNVIPVVGALIENPIFGGD